MAKLWLPRLYIPAAVAAAAGYRETVLADSPVAYYRLGEASGSALDSSGNGFAANWTAPPAYAQAGAILGDANTSVALDGGRWGVVPGDPAALRLMTGTAEAWVRTTFTAYGAHRGILTKPNAFGLYLFDNRPACYGFGTQANVYGPTYINDGLWHHLAVTFGGGTMELFCDGVQVASGSHAVMDFTNALTIGAGSDQGFYNQNFVGNIDEAAVYPVKLSAARIAAHYRAGRFGPPAGYHAAALALSPAAYYRLDDTGAQALDSSGNGRHLAFFGGVTKNGAEGVTFDGTTGYATAPTGAGFNVNGFSWAGWARWTDTADGNYPGLFSVGRDGTNRPLIYYSPSTPLGDEFALYPSSGVSLNGAPMPGNEWLHLACTWDGSTMRLYINGALVRSATNSNELANAAAINRLTLGAQLGGGNQWGGGMAGAGFWTRGLTAGEVAGLHAAGRPGA